MSDDIMNVRIRFGHARVDLNRKIPLMYMHFAFWNALIHPFSVLSLRTFQFQALNASPRGESPSSFVSVGY